MDSKFSDEVIWQVWAKGFDTGGSDALIWRKDECGAWLFRSEYGKRDSEYGWEIDHIKPVSEGGTDDISNLRPLHWENHGRKTDGSVDCMVTSQGSQNVRKS